MILDGHETTASFLRCHPGCLEHKMQDGRIQDFPRAFDLVVADGLYRRASFVRFILRHGKDAVIVLKDERLDLLQDARGTFCRDPPTVEIEGSIVRRMWDVEGLTSWTAVDVPIRVVRSLET